MMIHYCSNCQAPQEGKKFSLLVKKKFETEVEKIHPFNRDQDVWTFQLQTISYIFDYNLYKNRQFSTLIGYSVAETKAAFLKNL